jgi:hypothetical protein
MHPHSTWQGTHQQRTGRLAIFNGYYDALLFRLGYEPVHHCGIKVVSAQIRVATGGQHFHGATAHLQHGHVERTTA